MLRSGVIEPVDCADWATPLVPVTKKDGGLRVCADFKVTLNPVLKVDRYPLPKVEELFANLSGGELFTKIDLSQAYNQICLSEESKMLTVINTHRGLFKYNRLPYGLSSSSGIFCRISESIVRDIPNAQSFCDDILIFGKTREGHLSTLEAVLKRLKNLGLKLKKSKCTFLADEVCYLGFVVSKDGIKPDPNKVAAVAKMPPPSCVTEVRSFLGMVNFYSKFIPNASDILHPMHNLLKKGARWNWTTSCDEAFNKIKSLLIGRRILAHFDPNNHVTLTCDASPRGVAGVLSQPDGQGRERPVAYVSRKLNAAEQNYSQIHREALAIVFSTQKFHQYLYGKRFTLVTDHKPLISIFGPQTGVPSMTSSRMQRWALLLMAYDFDIQYVNSAGNCADALSRLPIGQSKEFDPPEQSFLHFASDALFLDCNEIRLKTAKDPLLGRVVNYIKNGWPDSAEIREMQPYFNRQKELYLELDCVMWGHRVVMPEACREIVLRELHEPHMGVVKTKAMARSYVWWPGMDEAIEARCRACDACAAVAPAPPASAPVPWHWPSRAYERVHIDFLGPLDGRTYMVSIDARSKWIEVSCMTRTTAESVISKLLESWARWGIPKQIVSDNGPPFSSKQFNDFLEKNCVRHIYSAPYHPASNGAAEGAVKLIKNVIKKAKHEGVNIDKAILKFLLHYHNTPHCTTGETPARLLQGRDLRIRLDAIKPDRSAKVINEQSKMVERSHRPSRHLEIGEPVQYRTFGTGAKWAEGHVANRFGKSDYTIVTGDGSTHHRHIDQMKRRHLRNSNVCPPFNAETEPGCVVQSGRPTGIDDAMPSVEVTANSPGGDARPASEQPAPSQVPAAPVDVSPRAGDGEPKVVEGEDPKRAKRVDPPLPALEKRVPKVVKRYGFEIDYIC
ncbi:uncharacterized protein K02A2.6-like isoform X1 [Cydia amplana]|uniref:uncharacterized protein K02A2.6-like isoform X1 n=1 Tax=Cydia amplana TaxID=1869771 RepID=UPI002FE4FD39